MSKVTVVLLGTLDTKGVEYAYVRARIESEGVRTLVIDAGVLEEPRTTPDIDRGTVATAAGTSVEALQARGDRGQAIAAMATGAEAVLADLWANGKLDAVIGLGGSGGSTLFSQAVRSLPVGVPKLLVSTVAAGDTRPYVGTTDLTMMYSVVDIAGINRLSTRILSNAAAAIAGMARSAARARDDGDDKPMIAATMFGVTTQGVTAARERLEQLGYEVLVFHATGTGGDTMEALVRSGFFAGVLDVTTTELADELAGGICAAGPERLTVAGRSGIPQVVSLGALDMVNFGPIATVPKRYQDRKLHAHNATITLMRTSPAENAELGTRIAQRLNTATAPVVLFIPLKGVSSISTAGQVFADAEADTALFEAIRREIGEDVTVIEAERDINDPIFARAMADALHDQIRQSSSVLE